MNVAQSKITEYVLGFAFDRYKNVALIHKKKPDWQAGHINGIGGKVERNEWSITAMKREFKEETDMDIGEWEFYAQMEIFHKDPSGVPAIVHCYRTFVDRLIVKTTTEEVVEIFNAHRLPSNVLPNLHWLIPLALNQDVAYAMVTYR